MKSMRKTVRFFFVWLMGAACITGGAYAQGALGSLDFAARITPTAARPEPVRQFTFYVLTKSYAEIVKDVEAQNVIPPRDKFIEDLKLSPELKEWLKAHNVFDLTAPDLRPPGHAGQRHHSTLPGIPSRLSALQQWRRNRGHSQAKIRRRG